MYLTNKNNVFAFRFLKYMLAISLGILQNANVFTSSIKYFLQTCSQKLLYQDSQLRTVIDLTVD